MADLTLQRIVESGLCTGCGACVYAAGEGAVQMQLNAAGFLRPVATAGLVPAQQARIRAVCPGIGLEHPPEFEPGTRYDPIWGPLRRVLAGHATDPAVRRQSSSGGVLSALLLHLLRSGAVDFVLHTRASRSDPLRNESTFSRTREDILEAAGSRYAPASPVAALPQALAQPGRFAFVGKPCDVAAVRKIINADPAVADRIPILISFMCAGTPSQAGTHEILQRLDVKAQDVVQFRYRGDGWPGLTRAATLDGRSATMDYNTAWGRILNRHLQSRCKLCADGIGEFADVVCADAWYGKDGYPDFAEREGRSLVVARTSRGERLIDAAVASRRVSVDKFDRTALRTIQPFQFARKSDMLMRCLAVKTTLKYIPRYIRLHLQEAAFQQGALRNAKVFCATLFRALQGRLK